jgi:predicted DNA-binding transcriptional regulator AlpA
MSGPIKMVGIEYLVPLLGRAASTLRVDVSRRPETLPPRLVIPGSSKVQWIESVVLEWIMSKQDAMCKPASIFRGRKPSRA